MVKQNKTTPLIDDGDVIPQPVEAAPAPVAPPPPPVPEPIAAGYDEKIAEITADCARWKKRYENARLRADAFNAIGLQLQNRGWIAPPELRQ